MPAARSVDDVCVSTELPTTGPRVKIKKVSSAKQISLAAEHKGVGEAETLHGTKSPVDRNFCETYPSGADLVKRIRVAIPAQIPWAGHANVFLQAGSQQYTLPPYTVLAPSDPRSQRCQTRTGTTKKQRFLVTETERQAPETSLEPRCDLTSAVTQPPLALWGLSLCLPPRAISQDV